MACNEGTAQPQHFVEQIDYQKIDYNEIEKLEVNEGFGNQINLCRYQGLSHGSPAQKSVTLPLDHQPTSY
uniref:(California timema) hypothetical protein n=1 Tax=Timema californicum TaxID=61474 RepID=A0A7R9IWI8_TIMCA|nr:unnamed protein product [Timema californicum]